MIVEQGSCVARLQGNLVEVWLSPIDHPKGELLLRVDAYYLKDLTSVLEKLCSEIYLSQRPFYFY